MPDSVHSSGRPPFTPGGRHHSQATSERIWRELELEEIERAYDLQKYLQKYSIDKLIRVWFSDSAIEDADPAFIAAALPQDFLDDYYKTHHKEKVHLWPSPVDLSGASPYRRDVDLAAADAIREVLRSGDLHALKLAEHPNKIFISERIFSKSHRLQIVANRSQLFSWVYDQPISRDLLYSKPPSLEKRRLVRMLVNAVRRRYRWITPRLLHTIAFRPQIFSELDTRHKSSHAEDLKAWGSLYRKALIPKSRGKRYLQIPNPPLKRIQKSLLKSSGRRLS